MGAIFTIHRLVSLHNTSTSSGPLESKYIHTTLDESKNQLITVGVVNVGMILEVQSEPHSGYADNVHGLCECGVLDQYRLHWYTRKKESHNMQLTLEKHHMVMVYSVKECAEGSIHGPLEPTMYPMTYRSHFRSEPQGLHGILAIDSGPISPESKSMNESFAGELSTL